MDNFDWNYQITNGFKETLLLHERAIFWRNETECIYEFLHSFHILQ